MRKMMKTNDATWVALAAALALAACGDGERGIKSDTVADADVADTTEDVTDTGDADAVDTSDTPAPLPNACDESRTCAQGSCRSGVCVQDPPAGSNAFLTDPVDNLPTTELPDLSCVDSGPAQRPIETSTTTMHGAVARFGKGRKTLDIKVEVFLADGFDPSACQNESTDAARRACYRSYGTPIASTLSVAPPTPTSLPDSCTEHDECPLGFQCFDPAELGGDCEEQFGLYELPGVPLDTPLVVRSYATTNENQWHDTWMFNVVLSSARQVEGRTQYDVQMVSHGQWLLTSNSVGLPDIAPTRGAIGGRIRDCQGERPYAWPISEVRLNLAQPGSGVVYFNNLEDDTVPLIDRQTTDILGRFAALDVPAGWNRLAGAARVGGQVVSVGSVEVYVIPNALSIVSWPGKQPYWRQQ